MPDTKITALTAISTVDPAVDVLPIVDVSDTTMAASGTTKKITSNQILGAGGTATLASATITGDLTVDTSTLKVDSANNRLGIGIATPNRNAVIYATASPVLQICDATTGTTANDGLLITQAGVDTFIENAEIGGMNFRTSAVTRYQIDSTGISTWSVGGSTAMTLNSTGLGVGVSPSLAKLQVDGGIISSPPTTPPTLGTNGQLTFNATSNTNLRFSYRGSDGTTRVADITLA